MRCDAKIREKKIVIMDSFDSFEERSNSLHIRRRAANLWDA